MTEIAPADRSALSARLDAWLAEFDARRNGSEVLTPHCGKGHLLTEPTRIYGGASCTDCTDAPDTIINVIDAPLNVDDLRIIRSALILFENPPAAYAAAYAATQPRPSDTAHACRAAYANLLTARTALAEAERAHFQAHAAGTRP